ncbi:MAG: glycosyltransferase [Bacteroidota bacterium]|nr:glycosyltransferase [Bacteroidota bacterium]
MKTICHITTGLNIGGAEMFLVNLASALKSHGYKQTIISLLGEGDLSDKVKNENIELIHLGINRYPWTWWLILKLPFLLRRVSPDIVQTWLYHADLIGGLAAMFIKTKLIWNVRQTDISVKNNKREIVFIARITALLSKYLPIKIICCSESVKTSHIDIGYNESRIVVIPNGCDTSLYKYDKGRRETIRSALSIDENDVAIGRFGRFDPQKDYKNFILAADKIQSLHQGVWFLVAGENISYENPTLMKWINRCLVPEHFVLLGKRNDLPDLYQAVDIMVSSSLGEGFPNVIAEAMSSEVPSVVTDVGESGGLVGDAGRVVPKEDSKKLADACLELINIGETERRKLGEAARSRIVNFYSLDRSVTEYRELYDQF